jgi:hypothetical protein
MLSFAVSNTVSRIYFLCGVWLLVGCWCERARTQLRVTIEKEREWEKRVVRARSRLLCDYGNGLAGWLAGWLDWTGRIGNGKAWTRHTHTHTTNTIPPLAAAAAPPPPFYSSHHSSSSSSSRVGLPIIHLANCPIRSYLASSRILAVPTKYLSTYCQLTISLPPFLYLFHSLSSPSSTSQLWQKPPPSSSPLLSSPQINNIPS